MIKILLCLTFLSIVGLSMAQMPRNIPKPTNPYGPKPGRLQCGLKTFFTYHGIVPQCFDHVPNKTCNVTYMMDVKIDPGFDYDQFEIQGEPMITWEADNNTFYLMLMMGWTTWYTYIVPSTPNDLLLNTDENEWIQWLVYDIPGMKIRKGKTFYQYMELQQPPHYWKHTYVFAIFKQHQGKLKDFVPPRLLRMGDHEFTKVKEFLRANKLRDPVAANIFNYRYMPDEYGPNIGYSSTLDSQFWAEKPTPIPYEHIQFDPNRKDYSVETVEV